LAVVLLWLVAVVSLLVGLVCWARANRLARKFDTLNQSYWELRYDYTRLKSQVNRIDPEKPDEPVPLPPGTAFISLGSLKEGRKKKEDGK
jgi:hypothetical protein